jgi:protein-S-isoprenylcysteine O-methyltransferase Ste14
MGHVTVSTAELRWVRWRARLGFLLAAVCLWLARPSADSILAGALIALPGLLIRGAASGHLRKGEVVAMSGPYARTRNPLYFGSAFLAAGFAIASGSWIAAVLVAGYYLALYPFLMRREERELRDRFGSAFDEYTRRVPLFWPRWRVEHGAGGTQFSWAQYARNREYQTTVGMTVLLSVLWVLSIWRR